MPMEKDHSLPTSLDRPCGTSPTHSHRAPPVSDSQTLNANSPTLSPDTIYEPAPCPTHAWRLSTHGLLTISLERIPERHEDRHQYDKSDALIAPSGICGHSISQMSFVSVGHVSSCPVSYPWCQLGSVKPRSQ